MAEFWNPTRSRWTLVSSAVCRNVPCGPVNVPRVSRSISSVILAQVTPTPGTGCDGQPGGAAPSG